MPILNVAEDLAELLRSFYADWNASAWDSLRARLSEEVQWDGEPVAPRDQIVERLRADEDREFQFEVFDVITTDDSTAVARVVHQGKLPNQDARFMNSYFEVTAFHGGALAARTTYRKRLAALEAAGIVETDGVLVSRADNDDWRLAWQEDYLMDAKLVWHDWSAPPPGRAWRLSDGTVMQSHSPDASPPARAVEEVEPKQWDHDHCDFCWAKFMDVSRYGAEWRTEHADILDAGYTPAPPASGFGNAWICPECFEDFRHRFRWTVVASGS